MIRQLGEEDAHEMRGRGIEKEEERQMIGEGMEMRQLKRGEGEEDARILRSSAQMHCAKFLV